MSFMFSQAEGFNHPLVWNTSNVTNMSFMFNQTQEFDQLLEWDTGNVTNMDYMFAAVLAFDQLLTWDLSKVKKERRHPLHEDTPIGERMKFELTESLRTQGWLGQGS